ncbi:MAG: PQQ-binding-like beta-propeller repeat protein, partial [Candidatus Desantisbacteria bacterium]
VGKDELYIGPSPYSLNPETGAEIKDLGSNWYKPPAITDDGLLIRADNSNYLYCLDPKTGSEVWKGDTYPWDMYSLSQPLLASDGTVYLGSYEMWSTWYRHIYSFDSKTGKLKWHLNLGKGGDETEHTTNLLLGFNQVLYVAGSKHLHVIGQKPEYLSIKGAVRKEDGDGLPMISINLKGKDLETSTTTAPDGTFFFCGLKPGVYELISQSQEFEIKPPSNSIEISHSVKDIDFLVCLDTISPNKIDDLRISDFLADSISLCWTSPGDDLKLGRALRYEIRYSQAPITEEIWNEAILVNQDDRPSPSGYIDGITIGGLATSTLYYFGVKAYDEFNNPSFLSNVASGKTSLSTYIPWTGLYQYRRNLKIVNKNSHSIQAGYTVCLILDTASLIKKGGLQEDGDDLRITYFNGESSVELDRDIVNLNSQSTEVWFKIQEEIPGRLFDPNYSLYYTNPDASAPPQDKSNLYLFYDGFDVGSLSEGWEWENPENRHQYLLKDNNLIISGAGQHDEYSDYAPKMQRDSLSGDWAIETKWSSDWIGDENSHSGLLIDFGDEEFDFDHAYYFGRYSGGKIVVESTLGKKESWCDLCKRKEEDCRENSL